MVRKLLYKGMIVLSMSALLAGCGLKEETVKTSTAEEASETLEPTKAPSKDRGEALGGNVGIAFPTKDNKKQVEEAEEIKAQLEEKGYEVEIAYAGGDGDKQAQQVNQMVEDKKNCLVILPIDSEQLKKPLAQADKQGITVVSYDQLITGTDAVSYYVGYDYAEMGKSVGSYLVETKKLDTAKKEKKSYTVEFFMGALNDRTSQLQLEGILEVLNPYLESGVLECKSLRSAYEDVSIAKGSGEIAGQTCDSIMKANYMDQPVDIVCVGNDDMVDDVVGALKQQSGFEENWPLVTGCGGTKEAFQRMKDGIQSLTIYNSRDNLPQLCADLIHKEIQGEEIKDLQECDNGTAQIPSVFGRTKVAYADNYQQVMKDAGITLDKE